MIIEKNIYKYLGLALYLLTYILIVCNQLEWGQFPSTILIGLIFLASIILWINVSIEWPSLITLILIGMLPEIGYNKLSEMSFGNQTFVFLIFTFAATQLLIQSGALAKLTQNLMNLPWVGQSSRHYMLIFLILTLTLACIFSPSVLFMFLFPMYQSICHHCQLEKGDPVASKYLIAFMATIAIGTAMTPINHIFALTAMTLFHEATGQSISYLSYMALGVPTGLCVFSLLMLRVYQWASDLNITPQIQANQVTVTYTSREKASLYLYGLMILLWLLPECIQLIGLDIKAFVGNGSMVFPPLIICMLMLLIKIDDEPLGNVTDMFNQGLHWPSLLLLSATLALGSAMSNPKIGFIHSLQAIIPETIISLPYWVIVSIFVVWAGLQTNFSSNLVTVSLVTTFLLSTFTNLPVNLLRMIVMMIGFMASMAVMTPPSMPYVAISIGSEWTNSRDCLKYGGVVLILTTVCLIVVGYSLMQLGF